MLFLQLGDSRLSEDGIDNSVTEFYFKPSIGFELRSLDLARSTDDEISGWGYCVVPPTAAARFHPLINMV
jgi:hypothetical protein